MEQFFQRSNISDAEAKIILNLTEGAGSGAVFEYLWRLEPSAAKAMVDLGGQRSAEASLLLKEVIADLHSPEASDTVRLVLKALLQKPALHSGLD